MANFAKVILSFALLIGYTSNLLACGAPSGADKKKPDSGEVTSQTQEPIKEDRKWLEVQQRIKLREMSRQKNH
jgi:hypothetical protein